MPMQRRHQQARLCFAVVGWPAHRQAAVRWSGWHCPDRQADSQMDTKWALKKTAKKRLARRHTWRRMNKKWSGQKVPQSEWAATAALAPLAICSLKATKRTSPMARGACHQRERGCLLQSLAITEPASHLISSLPATQFACLPYGKRVHARAARALMKK